MVRTPSTEDVDLLLEHTAGWLRCCVGLAAFAGLRVSAARALQVRDVDFAAGNIHVLRNFSGDKDGGVLVDLPKDGDQRLIPIHPKLRPLLVEACRSKLPKAHVLVTREGNIPRRQHADSRLRKAQRAAGLPEHGFHRLRAYFVTACLRGGAHPVAMMQMSGHADLEAMGPYLAAARNDLFEAIKGLK